MFRASEDARLKTTLNVRGMVRSGSPWVLRAGTPDDMDELETLTDELLQDIMDGSDAEGGV